MSFSIYTMPDTPDDEAERGKAVVRSGVLTIGDSAVLDEIVAEARRQLRTATAMLTIIYQDSAYVVAATGFSRGIYRRSTSFCGHAILTPTLPLVVPDTLADERFAGNPLVDGPTAMRFYAGVALTDERSMPLGALCVLDPQPRSAMTADESQCLRNLSAAATQHLRARLLEADGRGSTPRE